MEKRTYKKLLLTCVAFIFISLPGELLYFYETRHYIRNFYPELYEEFQTSFFRKLQQGNSQANASLSRQIEVYTLLKSHLPSRKRYIIFVGDSLIEKFEWSEYFLDLETITVLNKGLSGDTVYRLIDRLNVTFLPELHPKVLLMVGINDISLKDVCEDESFVKAYYSLLDKLLNSKVSPADVYVQSILPVRRVDKSNEVIRNCNRYIKNHCDETGITYIDIHNAPIDTSGKLDPRFSLDGLHLNAAGYKIWADIIRSYLTNLVDRKVLRVTPMFVRRYMGRLHGSELLY